MKNYTCKDLNEMSEKIEEFSEDLLFEFDDAGMSSFSEQYFLLALAALAQASRYMKIADIHQMRETK